MVSIRYKLLLIIISLLTANAVLLSTVSIGLARAGITKIASEFLGYKMNQIISKADTETENLKFYNEIDNPIYIEEMKNTITEYANSITKQGVEVFIVVNNEGVIKLSNSPNLPRESEFDFFSIIQSSKNNWISFKEKGYNKVGFFQYYSKWDCYFILTSYANIFFYDSNKILQNSIALLIASLLLAFFLFQYFINLMLKPLKDIVNTMNYIIDSGNSSQRVKIKYNDEIGEMAFTFNNMLDKLNYANHTIKEYAFQSVLSQKKEERVKLMFQKYVPQDVIDEIVYNPDKALMGKNSNVAILFSDIRSFTTISESMSPDKLVADLNQYFTKMVDVIYQRKGVIDKYIGDAIMAIFGAPKEHEDDPQQAVLAALEMMEELEHFNAIQRQKNAKEFHIGIGINYGIVTAGNIGSSRKMDYTVIGDSVNLASRLESLTKEYRIPIIISENTYRAVKEFFYVREIDRVRVKGKQEPVKIFQPARHLTNEEKNGWAYYNEGVKLFLEKSWSDSEKRFLLSKKYLGEDFLCNRYLKEIKHYQKNPPPYNWDGVTTMTHK